MKKALFILFVILVGFLFPALHQYTFIIRPALMAMLFFSFMGIQIRADLVKKAHLKILGLNILLPLVWYWILLPINPTYAAIGFVIGIIPTAVAAQILADVMRKNVGLVAFSVLLTTPIIAFVIPFMMHYLLGFPSNASILELILPVLSLILIPLFSSQFIKIALPKIAVQISKFSFLTFPLFLMNVFIACGNSSNFIQGNEDFGWQGLFEIFAIVSILGFLQFQIGQFLGRPKHSIEFGLAMGRKNTMIGIWLGLTYFEPIVSLGPVCYIIFQNIYNLIQIWRVDK